ncbi:MAG: hypothetical protein EXR99_04265 [Gemmataceae bacterium]|nr:hypothetical protein [Gemmataceae bacterium]
MGIRGKTLALTLALWFSPWSMAGEAVPEGTKKEAPPTAEKPATAASMPAVVAIPIPPDATSIQDLNKITFNAEYLLWWLKGGAIPPLGTTGTAGIPNAGGIGQPGTEVLFGDSGYGGDLRQAGRFVVAYWLGNEHNYGLEANFLFVGTQTSRFEGVSNGAPLLARPFTDATTGANKALIVAAPGVTSGGLSANVTSKLWGAEANFRHNLQSSQALSIDGIAGFRYLGFSEDLFVTGTSFPTTGGGVSFGTTDEFNTTNGFYGAQLGASVEYRSSNWFAQFVPKLGIGSTSQATIISGATVLANGTAQNTGLLAVPSNSGSHSRDIFTFVPEISFNMGYQFNGWVRAYAGYNIIYWSSVARSGQAVDLNLGNGQPQFNFNASELWLQGINLGLDFKF